MQFTPFHIFSNLTSLFARQDFAHVRDKVGEEAVVFVFVERVETEDIERVLGRFFGLGTLAAQLRLVPCIIQVFRMVHITRTVESLVSFATRFNRLGLILCYAKEKWINECIKYMIIGKIQGTYWKQCLRGY